MKRLKRPLLYLLLVGGLLFVAWAGWLDRRIVREFEARRWSEPARVYAEPLELYAGRALAAADVEQELRRLGYRRVSKASAPGSYERNGSRLAVATRAVRFYDETRAAGRLTIDFDSTSIKALRDGRGKAPGTYRLDPLLIGSIFAAHGEDRIVLAPDDVPALLPRALRVVEDRDFEHHIGVDFSSIARAMLANVKAGGIEQGASTITQQLVRSYFLDNRQTFARKAKEALMAVLLDAHFSKRDIMTAYVNEVYLGQDGSRAIHGFGLASQFYFGRSIDELEIDQLALLVAVVRGPSYYDPRRHADRALARRNLVLRLLGEHGVVKPADAATAAKRPLGVTGGAGPRPGYYPAFIDLVRRTLRRDYRERDITEAGLRVFTTLDPRVQAQAERALGEELARLESARRRVPALRGARDLEGVVVVTMPQSGDVIALIGGRRNDIEGFNRALDARRPIGSLVKPAVYLAAIESGRWNAASIIEDEPLEVKLRGGKSWRPQNITPEFYGPVPLVRALAQSMNLATVNLGMQVGVRHVADRLEQLGFDERPAPIPAMLLGAANATPLEVAQLYGSFASGGFRTPLRAVRAVVDPRGKPLKSFELEAKSVADPAAVYEVDRMLVEVMNRGTGAAARARLPAGLVVAGKTGTSSDYRDSWFAGFSGSHLAVVWVGRDDNRPTGLTGSAGALPVWSNLFAQLETTPWQAPLPEALEERWIEYGTGYAADPECADDVVIVALPKDANVPIKPGCGTFVEDFATRVREWLRRVLQ